MIITLSTCDKLYSLLRHFHGIKILIVKLLFSIIFSRLLFINETVYSLDTFSKMLVAGLNSTEVYDLTSNAKNCKIEPFDYGTTGQSTAGNFIAGNAFICQIDQCFYFHSEYQTWVPVDRDRKLM